MLPGIMSKLSSTVIASATVINVRTDMILLTGNTPVQTLIPNFGGGFNGAVTLISLDVGGVPIVATGNIADSGTIQPNQGVIFYFSRSRNKWFPNF